MRFEIAMIVVGRKEETAELRRCERSDKSELVCVYGRRRVGKTYLVEQTFAEQFAFRATGVENANTRQQLRSFNQRLREHGDKVRTIPRDWFEAFSRLETILHSEQTCRSPHGKRIVFLDEFPWFDTPRSDFLMAFGEFWNRCGSATGDFLFIICGSATSWIIDKVLENSGSLFNRVTSQIHLDPFCLRETEQLLAARGFGWSRAQIAEAHMVFGGLPYFLGLLDGNESLGQNIDRLCLAPHALLRHESKTLMESTLRKSPVFGQIVEAIAPHPYGLRKESCYEQLEIPKGTFQRAVSDLAKCGYVREYKNPSQRRKPLYLQLVDPFLLFHYTFLEDRSAHGPSSWGDFVQDGGRYTNWRGHAFENLCGSHLPQIKAALGIAGVRTVAYPWASERVQGGTQVDMVIERADGICDLCEMKYTDAPLPISAAYEQALLRKRDVFGEETRTRLALKLVMVTSAGISGVAHTEHIAQVLTLDDLFA